MYIASLSFSSINSYFLLMRADTAPTRQQQLSAGPVERFCSGFRLQTLQATVT